MSAVDEEARQRLLVAVATVIRAEGWTIAKSYSSTKKSTYFKCVKYGARMTVRVSNHPPVNYVGCSIHPGGANKQDLIKALRQRFKKWVNGL